MSSLLSRSSLRTRRAAAITLAAVVALSGALGGVALAEAPAASLSGTAPHAMVAAAEPDAVEAGLKVLKAGGSAVDAAVAANAVLGFGEPISCGVGGDCFVMLWDPKL